MNDKDLISFLRDTVTDLLKLTLNNEHGAHKSSCHLATKQDLNELESRIMSAISDYSARVGQVFDSISASVDGLVSSITGVTGDIAGLKDLILKLQNSPGTITPEDQALLDALEAKITSVDAKTTAAASALAALDAQTEAVPTPPAP